MNAQPLVRYRCRLELLMTIFVVSKRSGVDSDRSKIGVACVQYLSLQSITLEENRRDFCRGASPGNADWEGRKADSIGIRPVHLEWTVVDG